MSRQEWSNWNSHCYELEFKVVQAFFNKIWHYFMKLNESKSYGLESPFLRSDSYAYLNILNWNVHMESP
jgi:hypothetical protein